MTTKPNVVTAPADIKADQQNVLVCRFPPAGPRQFFDHFLGVPAPKNVSVHFVLHAEDVPVVVQAFRDFQPADGEVPYPPSLAVMAQSRKGWAFNVTMPIRSRWWAPQQPIVFI